jgi:hypothetical protein
MKKILLILGTLNLSAAALFASTINTSTATNGTTFSGFDNGPEKETDLALGGTGAVASVGGDVCTFVVVGTGNSANSQCVGLGFSITLTPPNSQTGSATWTITNTAGTAITDLTLNIQPSNSAFFPCLDKNGNIAQGNCAHSAGSVSTISGGTGGTSAIVANVDYTNLATDLNSGGGHPFSPLYGQVTFHWTGSGGGCVGCTVFSGVGTEFTFGADTELFAPVPEPATYGMVGLALAGLGALRFRRRKS